MKKIILWFLASTLILWNFVCMGWDTAQWGWVQDDPLQVLDRLKSNTQKTRLDDVPLSEGSDTPIFDTLKEIADRLGPYIQWAIYIWLSVATILLIFNWVLLVISPLKDTYANVKTRVTSILMWVAMLTGFFLVIKLIMSIISNIV